MLRLSLFGTLSFTVETGQVSLAATLPPTPLGGLPGGLLAYLALGRGRYFSRSELVETLWSDGNERTGKLNTALWRLRKIIERPPIKPGELIACDRRGAVGMHPNAEVELDVEVFARRVVPALNKPIERITEDDIEALRQGVALYSADILTDFSNEWALREREKQRRHYLNALGRLMHLCMLAMDWSDGIRYAQTILDRDALREDVHRDLMHMYVQSGQRAMALRQFEICRTALKRELAIQPMGETMALYHAIADQAVGLAAAGLVAVARIEPSTLPSNALSPRELIEAARRHLAEADVQLQLSLPLINVPLSR